MPDLNLQDEEGSLEGLDSSGDEGTLTVEEGEPRKKGSGLTALIVIVIVLIVGGGGVFLLNKLGVIKLWGKKATPEMAQMQVPTPADQQAAVSQQDTSVSMIETPPLGDTKKPGGKAVKAGEKPSQPPKEMPTAAVAPRLGEMKGEYTVQVSAWKDKETAEEMVRRLEEGGYPAFVEEREYKDGIWYTVRVGRYGSRKEAQAAVETFAEELKSSYWIDRVRSK